MTEVTESGIGWQAGPAATKEPVLVLGSTDNGSPSPRKWRLTWENAQSCHRRRVTRRSGSPWSGFVSGCALRDRVTNRDDLSRCDTGRRCSS